MPNLKTKRPSQISDNFLLDFYRWSSTNNNEDGTLTINADYWNSEADFDAGKTPLESVQVIVAALPAVTGALNAAMKANKDIDP